MRSGWKPEDRLDRAMQVFWEKGYYDTSIEDLMQRTGLHRAAVYGEYGNKRSLFETRRDRGDDGRRCQRSSPWTSARRAAASKGFSMRGFLTRSRNSRARLVKAPPVMKTNFFA